MALRILFLGGTGIISSASVALAVQRGLDVTVVNRGRTSLRPPPTDVTVLHADVQDPDVLRDTLQDRHFDVVADFTVFGPAQVRDRIAVFTGRTEQYVFISSASAYQKPPARLPITESTPLHNPFWEYSRNKTAAEDVLVAAYRESGFPATIVRPSHTYDRTSIPLRGGWTVLQRLRDGRPVVVHGDGTSLWVLTHATDFARAFIPMLGNPRAVGDSFHITSDEVLSWNSVVDCFTSAMHVDSTVVHVASDAIAAADPDWGASLLGDKAHSVVFDNSKIRSLVPDFVATVPFWQGAREIVDWYLADPARQVVDADHDALLDRLIERFG